MKKIYLIFLLLFLMAILTSCAGKNDDKDTSDLWKKSNTVNDVIERSGTPLATGSNKAREIALKDAENRLSTGGGLFGNKPTQLTDLFGKKNKETTSIGLPINPFLWRASLETIDFMPLASADPFSGIIITDWYSNNKEVGERCKLNIFVKGKEMRTENLKVNSFCQKIDDKGQWIDQEISLNNNIQLENAILNKAKKIRSSQN